MEVKYGNDKTEELKKKDILKENNNKTDHKMIEKTPYIMDETMYFHSFMKG